MGGAYRFCAVGGRSVLAAVPRGASMRRRRRLGQVLLLKIPPGDIGEVSLLGGGPGLSVTLCLGV